MLLSLNKINLNAPLNQTGECLILTELILPRPGIAKKSALKELRLSKGKASLVRAPFYENALFKEKVDGPFGIKVSVTRPLKHPEWNQFLRHLLATGIEGLGDAAALSAFPNLSVSAFAKGLRELVKVPFDEATEVLESEESFIALGGIDLDSETLVSGKIAIPLELTKTFRKSDLAPGPKAREKRRSQSTAYQKGSTVGELTLDVQID